MHSDEFIPLNSELGNMAIWRALMPPKFKRIVATNGCFDILHYGHVKMLQEARKLGDLLVVGLNSDESVKQLKGDGRPIHCQKYRKAVLEALSCVDKVVIFNSSSATAFLSILSPDVYVKSGDYSLKTLNKDERQVLQMMGTKIHFAKLIGGISTTNIIKQLNGQ